MSYVDAGYTIVLVTLAVFSASVVLRERAARARAGFRHGGHWYVSHRHGRVR